MWGVRGRALSHPRPLVRSGVRLGPTTHWLLVRGVRVWGPVTNPTAHALACCGGDMRVPGGSASCLGVGPPGTGALPPPTSRSFGREAGAHYSLAVAAGRAGVGTRYQPHSARYCALWVRHEGARGGRLLPGCGVSGVGRSLTPDHSSFQACGRGRLPTGCGCRGRGRWDQSPTPQCVLLRAGFARCGGGMRVPGGGRPLPRYGASGDGRSPDPDLSSVRVCGRGPLPTRCGCGGCGLGTRHQPHSARSCAL